MAFVCWMGSFLLRMMYARTVESYAFKRNEFGFVNLARRMDSGSMRLVAILGLKLETEESIRQGHAPELRPER